MVTGIIYVTILRLSPLETLTDTMTIFLTAF